MEENENGRAVNIRPIVLSLIGCQHGTDHEK